MDHLRTFSDLIAEWPKVSDFAAEIGAPYGRVHRWKTRNSIPSIYWDDLIAAAAAIGIVITHRDCAAMQKRRGAQ